MDTIEEWIIEDILKSIKQIGFSVEQVPLSSTHALTDCKASVIMYNPDSTTIFELAEEYEHAKNQHHRQWTEYDVRNKDEAEAHHLALDYILDRWQAYEGSNNWLTFMTVTGTPNDYEDDVAEALKPNTSESNQMIKFG
ncbi:hypothetical protein JOC36_000852 [Weissella uvarum]|nr:hypothetical protein [Weissella uvarum]MBM7617303.1 hypothetical protein [Weissella uvarum]MCM0595197.1 hypothetical protein [Weissella uvarum]